jgi:hypothetical protein
LRVCPVISRNERELGEKGEGRLEEVWEGEERG